MHPLTHQPSAQWECLSDAGDMELCATKHSFSDQEDGDSRNVTMSFQVLTGDSFIESTMRSESMQKLEDYVTDTPSLDGNQRVPVHI